MLYASATSSTPVMFLDEQMSSLQIHSREDPHAGAGVRFQETGSRCWGASARRKAEGGEKQNEGSMKD